jgi:hypothetical protein
MNAWGPYMRFLTFLNLLLILTSCAQLHTSRTYLSEMEYDDTPFFEAGSDFPVMAGDSGRVGRSTREIVERTPASEFDIAEKRERDFLKAELNTLEAAQTEHAFEEYELYRSKFKSVSEKIYFLKLKHNERRDYLLSKGLLTETSYSTSAGEYVQTATSGLEGWLGMSKDNVLNNFGKPMRVEVAGNPSQENERWAYTHNGATKYIYFEAGQVQGWE